MLSLAILLRVDLPSVNEPGISPFQASNQTVGLQRTLVNVDNTIELAVMDRRLNANIMIGEVSLAAMADGKMYFRCRRLWTLAENEAKRGFLADDTGNQLCNEMAAD